jgi:hypothetical protein
MVLYTEMVAANTLAYNEEARHRSLVFNEPIEHPVVLQLGKCEYLSVVCCDSKHFKSYRGMFLSLLEIIRHVHAEDAFPS